MIASARRAACAVATLVALVAPLAFVREARARDLAARDLAARIERRDAAAIVEARSASSLAPCVEDALLAQDYDGALDALTAAGSARVSAALRARSGDVRDERGEWYRTDDSEAANIIDERLARSSWWAHGLR